MPDELTQERAPSILEAWRLEQLLSAGWHYHRAELLAGRFDIDLHTALKLIENGCPQRLALQILL